MTYTVPTTKVERRSEVDFMRALMVLGLIFFHTARIFDLLPFNIKNVELSLTFTALVGFASQWGMPLFFVIAGIATWHAMAKRSVGRHILERTRRLVIPFIFGMLVIVPPLHYYTWRTNPDYHGSFWQSYLDYIGLASKPDFPWMVRDTAHLWFLYYLFVFSIICLPLFVYLRRESGRYLVARLASFCERSGAIFLFALPIVIIETFVVLEHSAGWNRFVYIPLLIYGYLLAADSRFEESMYRHRNIALGAGVFCLLAFFAISIVSWQAGVDPGRGWTWESIVWRFLKGCCSWAWIVAILGWAHSYVSRGARQDRPGLPDTIRHQSFGPSDLSNQSKIIARVKGYANEAVLPFYIIHQTVIVAIGFYVVKWQINLFAKYLIIVAATMGITVVLYELVRRTNLTRFLFGMKLVRSVNDSGGNEGLRTTLSRDIRSVTRA